MSNTVLVRERLRRGSGQLTKTWPTSPEDIRQAYTDRENAFLGIEYTDDDVRRLGLFLAEDSDGNTTVRPHRFLADAQFVTMVDAAAVATGGVSLEVNTELVKDEADREAARLIGEQIWADSKIKRQLYEWALSFCCLGKLHFEVVQIEGAVKVCARDPRHVRVWSDTTGEPTLAILMWEEHQPPELEGADEAAQDPAEYKRIVRRDEIDSYLDGVPVSDEVGPNPLGAVPVTTAQFLPVMGKELPKAAATDIEDAAALVDSIITQGLAIGTRSANPILVAIGSAFREGEDTQTPGKAVNLLSGDVKILEATLQGVQNLTGIAEMVRKSMREAHPEFLFQESGVNASGTALTTRAQAFVDKATPFREAFYEALATATGMAVAMVRGQAWSEALNIYTVNGGPALSLDKAAFAKLQMELAENGYKLREDVSRDLQGAGLIPDTVDPVDYTQQSLAEQQALAGGDLARLQQVLAMMDAGDVEGALALLDAGEPEIPEPEPEPEPEPGQDGDDNRPPV